MSRVLLVEDDLHIVAPLTKALKSEGFNVLHVADGISALATIKEDPPDLLLLDISLPDLDGFIICKSVRSLGLEFPIMMMTARSAKKDIVAGLNCGADDYLVKPFVRSELLARIRAVSRRYSTPQLTILNLGKISINRDSRELHVSGKLVELTVTEFEILNLLMQNHGKLVRRSRIVREIWNTVWTGPSKNLDMHISTLRRKLGPGTNYISTIRGLGFRFNVK